MGFQDSDIRDGIQDVFTVIWKNELNLNDLNNSKSYLLTSLRNYLINLKGGHTSIEEDDAFFISDEGNEEDQLALSEKVKSALDKLPARQREILVLKHYEGMDNEEIAEILEMNYQSVRNLYSRALKSLREVLISFLILLFFYL